MRRIVSFALAAAMTVSLTALPGASANAEDMRRDLLSQGWQPYWKRVPGHHRYDDRYDNHGHHHHGHWDDDWDDGDYRGAAAAGIIGFAAGAIAGGALATPPPVAYVPAPGGSGHVARCRAHYRSYDVRTDTFLGYDGDRHYCRL